MPIVARPDCQEDYSEVQFFINWVVFTKGDLKKFKLKLEVETELILAERAINFVKNPI